MTATKQHRQRLPGGACPARGRGVPLPGAGGGGRQRDEQPRNKGKRPRHGHGPGRSRVCVLPPATGHPETPGHRLRHRPAPAPAAPRGLPRAGPGRRRKAGPRHRARPPSHQPRLQGRASGKTQPPPEPLEEQGQAPPATGTGTGGAAGNGARDALARGGALDGGVGRRSGSAPAALWCLSPPRRQGALPPAPTGAAVTRKCPSPSGGRGLLLPPLRRHPLAVRRHRAAGRASAREFPRGGGSGPWRGGWWRVPGAVAARGRGEPGRVSGCPGGARGVDGGDLPLPLTPR